MVKSADDLANWVLGSPGIKRMYMVGHDPVTGEEKYGCVLCKFVSGYEETIEHAYRPGHCPKCGTHPRDVRKGREFYGPGDKLGSLESSGGAEAVCTKCGHSWLVE